MSTDADLAARFDAAIGDGPDHRPLGPVLHTGRRRVVGRRIAAAVAAAAVMVTIGAAALAGGSREQAQDIPPAGAPSRATPSSAPSDEPTPTEKAERIRFRGQLAVATGQGELVVNPLATIQRRLTVRYGGEVGYAVVGTLRGRQSTLFTTMNRGSGMSIINAEVSGSLRAWALNTLREYVRANRNPPPSSSGTDDFPTPAPDGLVTFPDGRLVPAEGVEITDQVSDVDFENFAEPGEPTAAARFTFKDQVFYLVARPDDVIAVEAPRGVRNLEMWVDFAQDAYASGVGLR